MRPAPSTPRRSRTRALLAIAVALPLLSGCTVAQSLLEGPTPVTPERETPAPAESAPELVPGGSAADNLPYFTEVLRRYSEGEAPVQGRPVVDAVAEAGFDKAAMQVSFDESKTGLVADSIFVSVLIGSDCLIGQIVTGDRSFVAENEPAVGPDGDICLIGRTRPIDW
ncbi:MAG: hypothetical protein QM606_00700 [Leucobacter sp.]